MKSKIHQLLKNTEIDESIVVNDPVKSSELEFPLRTVIDLPGGGYTEHYKNNTLVNVDQSNHVDKLFPTREPAATDAKRSSTKDPISFADFKPEMVCPKCKGPNLFNSMLSEYVECEDCDTLVLRENLEMEEGLFDSDGDIEDQLGIRPMKRKMGDTSGIPDDSIPAPKRKESTGPVTHEDISWAVMTAKREAKNPAAQSYLQNLDLASLEYGKEGVLVQLLYVLSNLGTWRGENAKAAKDIMKRFLRQNGKKI